MMAKITPAIPATVLCLKKMIVPAIRQAKAHTVNRKPLGTNTSARINVSGSKASELLVYKGQARLVGRDGEVTVRSGEKGYVDSEGYLGAIVAIPRVRDEFDLWCARNYEKYTARDSRVYLDGDAYYAGIYDLDYHGDWVFVAEYGRCWRPRAVYGWYPYRDGHWVWSVHWGWTWVSYEPWGWIPYHYGRWVHSWRWGWIWVPGRVWGPAWVTWVYYDDCIGWGPLCPWGHPCYCYEYRCHWPWTYVYRYSFYHPRWRYRHRRGGRYKYWTWGEKRYKYRDGRKHDKADYRMDGPKSPRVATKSMKLTDAEKKIMKAEMKVSAHAPKTIPKEKSATRTVDNRNLPSKPRTADIETQRSVEPKRSESASPTGTARNAELPPKPRKAESSTSETSRSRETRPRQSSRTSRSETREESSYETYEAPPVREERQESEADRRNEDQRDDSRYEREERQPRSDSRNESVRSDYRDKKDDGESRREDASDRSRSESDRSRSSSAKAGKKSIK